jgi:hypothetical protein
MLLFCPPLLIHSLIVSSSSPLSPSSSDIAMEDPLFGQSLIANKPTTTTTPPRLNIHGDPMSQNKYVPSAVGHGRPTAVVLLYNKVPNLTPKEKFAFACLRLLVIY